MKGGRAKARNFFSTVLVVLVSIQCVFCLSSSAGSSHNNEFTNLSRQNYTFNWAETISSYLSVSDNGFMRVQAYWSEKTEDDHVFVEYYDDKWNFKYARDLKQELPRFGAFYESENYYYLLTGQTNFEESPNVECFRLTKYDKNWTRITSTGVYDCFTTRPFEGGRTQIAEIGNEIIIHSSHLHYKSEGIRHESNITLVFDSETMNYLGNYRVPYVSHSFDQFVLGTKTDKGNPMAVFLDLSDGYPYRALNMMTVSYTSDSILEQENNNALTSTMVFEIFGEAGDNNCYLHVGGFEEADDSFLTTYKKSRESDGTFITPTISVASIDKESSVVKETELYQNEQVNDPKLAKLPGNRFLVIWSVPGGGIGDSINSMSDMVYYQEVNENGKPIGKRFQMVGHLSDCQPTLIGNKVYWYAWNFGDITLFSIDASELEKTETISLGTDNSSASTLSKVEKIDGKWVYTKNGVIDTSFSGIAKNEYGWWRVKNGYVDFKANGIYKNQYGWWKTTDGKVTFKETGVFKNEYGWWRVEDSKVNFKANGIYKNQYGWWKTTDGKVTFKENGVFKNDYGWWKVKDSKVDFNYTGIAKNKYGRWYVKNGKVDFNKNGKVTFNGTTYTVKNGKVQ